MSSQQPLVSIVVVNYNGAGFLGECLKSVFAQPYRPIEVIVVDNGSSDESVNLIRNEFTEVLLKVNVSNEGFAGGNNRGVSAAKGDMMVLLNNDTVVDERWLFTLVDALKDPRVGVVTSKVITEGVPDRFYQMNGTLNYAGYNIMRHFTDLSTVFFAGGASLGFRRDVVGVPFPEEFFLYHEDVFLSWRMRLKGFAVKMVQESVVWHKGSETAKRQTGELVTFYQERNRLLNCLFFYQSRTLLLLIPYFIADGVAKILLSCLIGRKSLIGILRSYWWIMTHGRWIFNRREELQLERQITDREILRLMSAKVVDSDSIAAKGLNKLSMIYARVTGLAHG